MGLRESHIPDRFPGLLCLGIHRLLTTLAILLKAALNESFKFPSPPQPLLVCTGEQMCMG